MLIRRAGEVREEEAADKSLKDFRSGTEERDRAVGSAEVNRFIGFEDREDQGMLPDSG